MEKISTIILKTAIEAIPLLNQDTYTLWKNIVKNMLNLQELLVPLTSPTGVLTASEDVQLQTILNSKLESSIHANVTTHDNEKNSKKIWKSISDYFASSQASNCARVFNAVLHIQFNPNNVQDFITQVKSALSCLHEKCKKGWHNLQSTGQTLPNCCFLYPHLRPGYEGDKGKKSKTSLKSFTNR
ncbi:uncharacterized protein VP01_5415g5 [Puccinia sorghi]|uniref:Uncharacterized protein n=1 Tax=Puccinia sorghi TaxID=27349 RepID=A0A0L6UKI5_9BASI|nr:uncharacterized protein VP01_5415g5 [Puccinia sorghi]